MSDRRPEPPGPAGDKGAVLTEVQRSCGFSVYTRKFLFTEGRREPGQGGDGNRLPPRATPISAGGTGELTWGRPGADTACEL